MLSMYACVEARRCGKVRRFDTLPLNASILVPAEVRLHTVSLQRREVQD